MADAEPLTLLIFGPPGSGKGTQASRIAERFGIPAISTGDMLRRAVSEGSALGQRVQAILDSGALVDDDTMADVLRDRLQAADAEPGFLLDGYPRTAGQAETLDGLLEERGASLAAVLHLEVSEAALVERLLGRGRADDSEEVIRRRLRVYRAETEPLVSFYRDRGLLVTVDGEQSIQAVGDEIVRSLEVIA